MNNKAALPSVRMCIPGVSCTGFSLLEVMVGLLVASLSAIMILQVFMLFDAQRRTVMSGDDAQSSGAIGFYSLQRDIRQGGYGINAFDLIGCDVLLPSGITLTSMAPVTINPASIPAGDPNTDTVLVAFGNNRGGPGGSLITLQPAQTTYRLASALFFATGDYVIAEPQYPTPRPACSLSMEVGTVADPDVTVATGTPGVANGRLYNLGPAPKIWVYAVRGGNLTVCDYMANNCGEAGNVDDPAVWKPIAGNIVSLRAQYGRDTDPMDPTVDPTVDLYDQAVPVSNCDWARIRSVRFVMTARSGQPVSGDDVTAGNPTWAGSVAGNPTGSASNPIDLSQTTVKSGSTWRKYRYKVFETIIPIRNITLLGGQAGC